MPQTRRHRASSSAWRGPQRTRSARRLKKTNRFTRSSSSSSSLSRTRRHGGNGMWHKFKKIFQNKSETYAPLLPMAENDMSHNITAHTHDDDKSVGTKANHIYVEEEEEEEVLKKFYDTIEKKIKDVRKDCLTKRLKEGLSENDRNQLANDIYYYFENILFLFVQGTKPTAKDIDRIRSRNLTSRADDHDRVRAKFQSKIKHLVDLEILNNKNIEQSRNFFNIFQQHFQKIVFDFMLKENQIVMFISDNDTSALLSRDEIINMYHHSEKLHTPSLLPSPSPSSPPFAGKSSSSRLSWLSSPRQWWSSPRQWWSSPRQWSLRKKSHVDPSENDVSSSSSSNLPNKKWQWWCNDYFCVRKRHDNEQQNGGRRSSFTRCRSSGKARVCASKRRRTSGAARTRADCRRPRDRTRRFRPTP